MTIHICNTQFEWELNHTADLKRSFEIHPIHIQLQFLPLLYAPDDKVLITHEPNVLRPFEYTLPEQALLLDSLDLNGIERIESWGPSQNIAAFAKKHQLIYDMPPIECVKTIASKTFPYECDIALNGAALLKTKDDLDHWLKEMDAPFVIKAPFSTAGRDRKICKCKTALHYYEILGFCEQNWQHEWSVLAEPWVERSSDFSTQWYIEKSGYIEFLGWVHLQCSKRGIYRQSIVNDVKPHFFDEHVQVAKPLLEKMHALGFFGHVGLDAFVYGDQLHPVCEVNPRKTMGWLALELSKGKPLTLKYQRGEEGLLPKYVKGKKPFHLQLSLSAP